MPAAGLLVIKKRIGSVKSTQKITKALALVSTSKVRKAREKLNANNRYFDKLKLMKNDIFNLVEEFQDNEFVRENTSDKKLYVIFASNSGFCGGFNGNGTSYLSEKYTSKEERSKINTYVLGSKGVSYSRKYGFEVAKVDTTIKGDIEIKTARKIAGELMNMYYNGEYKEISFIYTKYTSGMSQDLLEVPVLPLKIEKTEETDKRTFEIELDPEMLIDSFIYRYVEGLIINCVYNAMSSEENARMQAMDGATKNADDIIDNLNTKYNRIRQAAITQEISEIVGGAEAQK